MLSLLVYGRHPKGFTYFIHLINNEVGMKMIKEEVSVLEPESIAFRSHDGQYLQASLF